ncbi:hypothetical protein NECAME_03659 [Necator americanus]|uniref:Uncharacterized protein n=1 Tax=Necator americanus TaxID=51031 RepID=W2T3T7_NECAM|nr:hypothetical protein NECAME_03659 [Necator americanus]ETN75886.1 hypothetical protein NECAME_03659 [Necator americanus]
MFTSNENDWFLVVEEKQSIKGRGLSDPWKFLKKIIRQTSFGVTVRVHATSQSVALRVLNVAVASFELLGSIMVIPLPLNKV